MDYEVAVVGGGVIGLAVARAAARAGLRTVVLERESCGAGASGAAAGMLAPLAEAHRGPFLDWCVAALRLMSAEAPVIEGESGVDLELRGGMVHLVPEEELAERLERAATAGLPLRRLTQADLRELAPGVSSGDLAALWSPDEAVLRPSRLVIGLRQAAERAGAEVREGEAVLGLVEGQNAVRGVRTSRGEVAADHVVVAAGAWTDAVAPGAGIRPVHGVLVELEPELAPFRPAVFGPDGYAVPRADGRLWWGATQREIGFATNVPAEDLAVLIARAVARVPALGDARFLRAWSGLRPAAPDRQPLVGPDLTRSGLWWAAGHFRNGILLSLLTGEMVAAGLLGRTPPADPRPFLPARLTAVGR